MLDKLKSRKFWMAILAVMVVALGLFGYETDNIKQIVEIASGMAVMLGYILSEASIDKAALPRDTVKYEGDTSVDDAGVPG